MTASEIWADGMLVLIALAAVALAGVGVRAWCRRDDL